MSVAFSRVARLLAIACLLLVAPALAHDHSAPQGHHGVGHDKWHKEFYSKLYNQRTGMNCCSDRDCTDTQSRATPAGYEVMVDGEWRPVPPHAILKVAAPNGGAHVCVADGRWIFPKGTIVCVVLPPEG